MAIQSTLFSPCKYGILPEIVPKERLSRCNGMITGTTYLAIILGTFFAAFLTQASQDRFVFAALVTVAVAVLGAIASLWLPKTQPRDHKKKISVSFFMEIMRALKKARETRYLFEVILVGSYFLFMGAYLQLNMIPFTIQSLHLPEVQGGYLFLMVAIGIGIGSFLSGQLSGKETQIGYLPVAAVITFVCFLGLFVFQSHFFTVILFLVGIGVAGGFFIVPVDIFIQVASPDNNRGENVAAGNFLSFFGVIIASALLALFGNLFQMSAAQGFLALSIFTFLFAVLLFIIFADQFLRLFASYVCYTFWDMKVIGKRRLLRAPPTLLICQRRSWLDVFAIMATLPRLIRYIVPIDPSDQCHPLFYRILRMIPIDIEHFSPIGEPALNQIKKELESGHSVCLMYPDESFKNVKEWREKVEKLVEDIHVPVAPIYVAHEGNPTLEGKIKQFLTLFRKPVKVGYGTPLDKNT